MSGFFRCIRNARAGGPFLCQTAGDGAGRPRHRSQHPVPPKTIATVLTAPSPAPEFGVTDPRRSVDSRAYIGVGSGMVSGDVVYGLASPRSLGGVSLFDMGPNISPETVASTTSDP